MTPKPSRGSLLEPAAVLGGTTDNVDATPIGRLLGDRPFPGDASLAALQYSRPARPAGTRPRAQPAVACARLGGRCRPEDRQQPPKLFQSTTSRKARIA